MKRKAFLGLSGQGGHRRYPRAVLRRVAFIVFAQKIGLSLEEIGAELSKLPGHHVPERSDWAKLSGTWTKRINQRIAELERLKAGLTQCIGCGCVSRWTDVNSLIPATGPPDLARGLGIGLQNRSLKCQPICRNEASLHHRDMLNRSFFRFRTLLRSITTSWS